MTLLTVADWGTAPYDDVLQRQKALRDRVEAGAGAGADQREAFLLMGEHAPPVITAGRRARPEHLLLAPEALEARGIQYRPIERGGDVTWHGPGQLVTYPVMALDRRRQAVLADHVHRLEETVIQSLARFGIAGERADGRPGVWVGEDKIAAIGVAVHRWVAWHGFSINVSADVSGFDLIVPCGLVDCGVTSMERILERPVFMADVKAAVVEAFRQAFGL